MRRRRGRQRYRNDRDHHLQLSFPRKRESGRPQRRLSWTPAFAGVTVRENSEDERRHNITTRRLAMTRDDGWKFLSATAALLAAGALSGRGGGADCEEAVTV